MPDGKGGLPEAELGCGPGRHRECAGAPRKVVWPGGFSHRLSLAGRGSHKDFKHKVIPDTKAGSTWLLPGLVWHLCSDALLLLRTLRPSLELLGPHCRNAGAAVGHSSLTLGLFIRRESKPATRGAGPVDSQGQAPGPGPGVLVPVCKHSLCPLCKCWGNELGWSLHWLL